MQVRAHMALTDGISHVQNFSEYVFIKELGKAIRFEQVNNLRGTVAHESEHAWDNKLGNPSKNDPEFDRLYQLGVERLKEVPDHDLAWLTTYVVRDVQGKVNANPGKEELFADLGALAVTGEVSNKNVDPLLLKSVFRELNEYVEPKFKRGKW